MLRHNREQLSFKIELNIICNVSNTSLDRILLGLKIEKMIIFSLIKYQKKLCLVLHFAQLLQCE